MAFFPTSFLTKRVKNFFSLIRSHQFKLIVICYLSICFWFIFKNSFWFKGEWYFTLFDDSMISMRYARNLAEGYGLVWNPTSKTAVEGYSNLLWTLYMSFWHVFPIDSSKMGIPIQLTGTLFAFLNLTKVKAISERILNRQKTILPLVSLILVSGYLPLTFWALSGMSHVVLTFIVLSVVEEYVNLEKFNEFSLYKCIFLISLGLLIRLDFIYLYLVIWLFISCKNFPKRHKFFLYGIVCFVVVITGQTAFRYLYYESLLPNTYYLKLYKIPPLIRFKRGLHVTIQFIYRFGPILFFIPFLLAILKTKLKTIYFILYIFTAQILYNIYVGGDAWSYFGFVNRYLSVVMPLFLILIALALYLSVKRLTSFVSQDWFPKILLIGFILPLLLLHINDQFLWANRNIGLFGNPPSPQESSVNVFSETYRTKLGVTLRKLTHPEAKIAVVMAGTIPYFSERYCIDQLGYTDRRIALRKPHIQNWRNYRPGHVKYDPSYSIIQKKPDVITLLPAYPSQKILNYLDENYTTKKIIHSKIYFRKNSPNIHWSKF